MWSHFYVLAVQSMMVDCVVLDRGGGVDAHWEEFEWVVRLGRIRVDGGKEMSLRKRVSVVSLFARCLVYREESVLVMAHCVCLEHRREIEEIGVDEEEQKRFAERVAAKLLLKLLGGCRKKNGLLRAVKKMRVEMKRSGEVDVYKMTALILWRVYRIRCP